MDSESKKLLENTLHLVEENNKMLHKMRRSMRIARIMSILYWTFIIGTAVGAFYLLQPYMDSLMEAYGTATEVLNGFQ